MRGTHPDHSKIADFRKTHLDALYACFLDILRLCEQAGMVKLGRVALDGTKTNLHVPGSNSRSWSISQDVSCSQPPELPT